MLVPWSIMRRLLFVVLPALLSSFGLGCSVESAADSDDGSSEEDLTARDVIFSPQSNDGSHLRRIAQAIDGAKTSIDIAIYSYSDAGIRDALGRAVARGVKVRLLFNDAGDHERLDPAAKAGSWSGKLEALGVDVRFVNKIMHHKFMIVDGPRDDLARAKTALLVTGSANWSASAATQFDENTLFIKRNAELVLKFQRDFDTMWSHSRDFVGKPMTQELSTAKITDDVIPDDPGADVYFTSANFTANGTTFSTTGSNTIANALVSAIQGATKSIHLASGHLRSRPVSEALIAKKKASPYLDIRLYLDGQEYISKSSHALQVSQVEDCLRDAGADEGKKRDCLDRGFLFSYQAAEAGIDVRFKYYAYRWDHSYAPQMHHKFMVVDGKTLFTGSYNLSDNAEHDTFENMMKLEGRSYASVVKAFEQNFEAIWNTGRGEGDADKLASITSRISPNAEFPIVFDPIALTHEEVTALKAKIRSACPAVDSTDYRRAASAHRVCKR
jgi:phosphatidylserine/phosphatidylglycerophosphate/cardiolipin synthase-like enzyme